MKKQRLIFNALVEGVKPNHEKITKSHGQLSFITDAVKSFMII